MKRSVVQIIHEQPEWLPHVGWWRVLQVMQLLGFLLVFIPIAHDVLRHLSSITFVGLGIYVVLAILLSTGAAAIVRVIGWTIAWIITGFKETKKS